ncbi:MAG: AIPR family protein [Terriglobia bacterium]
MSSIRNFTPKEYRFAVSPDLVRSFRDPHNPELTIHHAYIPIRSFAHGRLPDKVNPRSHEKLTGRVPQAIENSVKNFTRWFHNLSRGLLVLAEKAWYDNRAKMLHVVIGSDDENGLADGATVDRVLDRVKTAASLADFASLSEDEIPDYLKEAYVHVEILSGEIGQDMLVRLTDARNTSVQVKAFSLENLGGGFDWLKKLIEASEFRGRVRYKENDPQPVDVRSVLGLLTLFHPKWNELGREPVLAYTSKGLVLDNYRSDDWKPGYKLLEPVVVDILRLFEYIHLKFHDQYKQYNSKQGSGSKLGARKEVRYADSDKKAFALPLTGSRTRYFIPDGWLYPLLAAFRMLIVFPKNARGQVRWIVPDPRAFFDTHGHEFVGDVVEQSETLGRNPNATGKSRPLWNNLRKAMELHRIKLEMALRR